MCNFQNGTRAQRHLHDEDDENLFLIYATFLINIYAITTMFTLLHSNIVLMIFFGIFNRALKKFIYFHFIFFFMKSCLAFSVKIWILKKENLYVVSLTIYEKFRILRFQSKSPEIFNCDRFSGLVIEWHHRIFRFPAINCPDKRRVVK